MEHPTIYPPRIVWSILISQWWDLDALIWIEPMNIALWYDHFNDALMAVRKTDNTDRKWIVVIKIKEICVFWTIESRFGGEHFYYDFA